MTNIVLFSWGGKLLKRWISSLFLILLLPYQALAAGYSTSIGDSDIMISGQKTISYRYAFAMGNKNIFRTDNMVSLGGTIDEQSTFLTINGKVPDKFSITGTLSDGTYMGSQASIEVKAKNVGLYLGDIAANLTGSEFGSFNKNLNGIKVEGDWGKSKFTLITSQLESQSKTETFQGNGTMGPYRLEYGWQIIEGTETVKVDGKTQVRRQDYRIDNGSLYFTNKFIYSFNTIQVSYEYSLDFNLNPGTLSGFRGTTQIGDKISLGTTVFRQTTNKYATGAIFRGIDTFSKTEFEELKDNEGSYTFQVQYWPIVDNSDSEVIVSVYTDGTSPAKSWSNRDNRYTQEPGDNVEEDFKKGKVTLLGLRGEVEEEKITRVEVEYYYQIVFPDNELEGMRDGNDELGRIRYRLTEKVNQQYLVEGKAYLKSVDPHSWERDLYPDNFELEFIGEDTFVKINKELFQGTIPEEIKITFFHTLPPAKEADDSYRANKTVVTLDGRAQLTPRISLQGEVGFSSGNRSADDLYFAKTINSIDLDGMIDDTGEVLFLFLGRFQGIDSFPLPIEPMSETITTRKTTGSTSTLRRGTDYEINFATGVIEFSGNAAALLRDRGPAGTFDSITLRYKYLDEEAIINEGDVVTGIGAKIGATANFDKASFNVNWRSLDREFSPLGMSRTSGYGSKELTRLSAGVTLRPKSFLQLSSNVNKSENLNVIKQGDDKKDILTENNQISNEVRLSVPGWPSLTLSNSQSLAPASRRMDNAISTNYNWKIFSFSGSMGTSDYSYDSSDGLKQYDQNTLRRNFNVTARPSTKFNTGYSFTNSVQLGTQANANNSSSNAHNLTMEFRPSTKLTLGGSYNIQLLDQTTGATRNIQRGSLNFTNNLSPKVTLRGSLTRSMDPGAYYSGSTMDYGNLSWNYNYRTNLSFSSSIYLSNSTYGNESYSRYGTLQGDVRYTPQIAALQKKRVQLTWSNSYRPSASHWTSTTGSKPTENQTATSSINVSFQPLPGLSLRGGYELQFNKSTSTSTVSQSPFTNTLTANGTYSFSYKVQATGNLRFSDNARSWGSSYSGNTGSGYGRKLEGTVGVNYTISPSARVNVDWKLIGYQDGKQHMKDANYFGNVITTKLVGTF